MSVQREKFATQLDSVLLAELRDLAKTEGRQIQALVEEAVAAMLEKRREGSKRDRAMALHEKSMAKYDALYKKLAQ